MTEVDRLIIFASIMCVCNIIVPRKMKVYLKMMIQIMNSYGCYIPYILLAYAALICTPIKAR